MTLIIWLGFLVSLAVLLVVGKKNIGLGLIIAALILGIFNLPFSGILDLVLTTLTDWSVILLAIAVGLIPLIGGLMESSGLIDDLVENLRMGKKLFLATTPALIGMLPMPGGALLSAPVVKKGSEGVPADQKVAINVWFRHVLIMIYPLADLLPSSKMANLNLYKVILYLLPAFFLMVLLGFIFLLKGIKGRIEYQSEFNLKSLIRPILVLFLAPLIHVTLMNVFNGIIPEIPLLIGVSCSLLLVVSYAKPGLKGFLNNFKKMKPWKFFLIIIGMFLFLNMFNGSGSPQVIADIAFSKSFLIVIIGAFFGFITGRVQVPVSILLPIYYSGYGRETMNTLTFSIMFVSIFMGYVISPVHPCVSVSIEYFRSDLKAYFRKLIIPAAIILLIMLVSSFFLP
ncbi:DUF401 family protein [bacterium]|nr:DUF401 family protein [bacterium]